MRKLIFASLLAFAATKSNAQALFITNNRSFAVDVTICGSTYTIPANSSMPSVSACTPPPCSFTVTVPCSGGATNVVPITDPNCGGSCPSSSSVLVPGTIVPLCPSFTVKYAYDCTGNLTVTIDL